MSKINFWNRKYIVDKRFQLGITIYFLSFYFIALVALYLFLRFSILGSIKEISNLEAMSAGTLELFKEHLMQILNISFIIFSVVGGVFAFFGGIFISNKMSGPIFRARKILQQMLIGNYKNFFKVRKSDYCAGLFSDLEKLNDSLMKKENPTATQ